MIPGTRSPPASQTRCWGDSGLDVILIPLGMTWPGLRVQGTSVSPGGASLPGPQEAPIPYEAPSVSPRPSPQAADCSPSPSPKHLSGSLSAKNRLGKKQEPSTAPTEPTGHTTFSCPCELQWGDSPGRSLGFGAGLRQPLEAGRWRRSWARPGARWTLGRVGLQPWPNAGDGNRD